MASAVSKSRPTLFCSPAPLFPSVPRNVFVHSLGRELASGRSDPWSDIFGPKKLRGFIRTRGRSCFRLAGLGHLIVLHALPALFGRSLVLFDFLSVCIHAHGRMYRGTV